jgi:FKBP-type peptidyl-prolyl cis-trans isomerase
MNNIIPIIIFLVVVAVIFYYSSSKKTEDNETQENKEQEVKDGDFMIESNQDLKIEVLKEGTGQEAKNGDKVTVHYTGWLTDGTKFDSSVDRGKPFAFTLGVGQVIKGWDTGILGAKVGEKRKLTIPSELGYGQRGIPGGPIGPNATLLFEVEVLGINQ